MDVLGSTDQVLLNLFRTQSNEQKDVSALATGLRIQSASDDPSGLGIAENLQSRVMGLQQASQSVQTVNNLLQVADATAANIQTVLQRIHSLIVQSASDINSNGDLQNIQAEIGELLHEINKISNDANFNGVKLFDGSHDTYVAPANAVPIVQEVNPGVNPDGSVPTDQVYDMLGLGTPNAGKLVQNFREGPTQDVEGFFVFRVTGYSTNPVDPGTGPLGQPGVYLENDEYSTDPAFAANAGQEIDSVSALPTGQGKDLGSGGSLIEPTPGNWVGTLTSISFDLSNLSAQDVGTAIAFVVSKQRQSGGGTAITANESGIEGDTVSISLPTLSTNALDISNITVMAPTLVNQFDNVVGADSSNRYAAADAEVRVQNAIDMISQVRAQVGAQSVALSENVSDSATAIVNLTASENAIRDVNIGQATTQFTKDQILSQVGESVLAQMQTSAKLVTQLLIQTL
ncbi:MAG: flagellin [Vulcanimicrobiaceae bacterium]